MQRERERLAGGGGIVKTREEQEVVRSEGALGSRENTHLNVERIERSSFAAGWVTHDGAKLSSAVTKAEEALLNVAHKRHVSRRFLRGAGITTTTTTTQLGRRCWRGLRVKKKVPAAQPWAQNQPPPTPQRIWDRSPSGASCRALLALARGLGTRSTSTELRQTSRVLGRLASACARPPTAKHVGRLQIFDA